MSGSPSGGSTIAPRRTAGAKPSFSSRTRAWIAGSTCFRWTYGDAVGIVADELEVVGAAVGDVPGVEAELHGLRVGAVEEALDLLLGADVAVGVGVEHQHGAMLVGDVPAELATCR